ncbi:unnamed protein product [Lepeophtheirus salmonis]|uniref:(salmon louse) hypothetical protein n=1 Tax=Lepeophtheirus salmonis TaxID=72036 RepID=A0A7R8CZ50_LEPSM|nr:unnamed protein product [Lepeophtheirus salmonis]CAF2973484.1 unnamed protein product [Lepeophtheirus salmonis]
MARSSRVAEVPQVAKSKILKEYEISTQDKTKRLFTLIDNPGDYSVTEIVSHARNYILNITQLREYIIKQIIVRSLPDTQRTRLSVQFADVGLDEFIWIGKLNLTMTEISSVLNTIKDNQKPKHRGTDKRKEFFYHKKRLHISVPKLRVRTTIMASGNRPDIKSL